MNAPITARNPLGVFTFQEIFSACPTMYEHTSERLLLFKPRFDIEKNMEKAGVYFYGTYAKDADGNKFHRINLGRYISDVDMAARHPNVPIASSYILYDARVATHGQVRITEMTAFIDNWVKLQDELAQ